MDPNIDDKKQSGSVHQATYRIVAYIYDLWVGFLLFPIGGWSLWRRTFVEFVSPKPGDRIVELCCGTGAVTFDLAKKEKGAYLYASDLSPDQIRVAKWKSRKKNFEVEFSIQNASSTTYKSSFFDKIIVSAAFHEMTSDLRIRILKEISRLLKPEGFFYITEPEKSKNRWVNIWLFKIVFNSWHPETKAVLEFINGKIDKELKETGFKVDEKIQEKDWYFQCLKCSKTLL